MAGRIPQSFIDQLLDRTDIVEVVDASVKLKKAGRNYTACCPFHQEKSPSFTVSPDKQFYYCFGCGAGGNALGFLMAHERLSFPEAVERLAHRAGMEVPHERLSPEEEKKQQRQRTLHDRLAEASDWYYEQLKKSPEAIAYLKQRGLSGQTAREYRIGFAPDGWDKLLKAFGQDDAGLRELLETGLAKANDAGKFFDFFRHRIMFPIRDSRGRVIAFGGRVLGNDKPKYLNSPETAVFQKGRELYGLYEARQAHTHLDRLLVVEGYMDVVMLAQHGIRQAVATLGTAVGNAHLERLFRHTSEVIFCFDGDTAGLNAARRALEVSLPTLYDGRLVRFMFLPDGEDPDSLVQKEGSAAFLERAAKAEPLSAFLFRTAATGIDTGSPDGRALMARKALELIGLAPEGMFRALLLQELGQQTGLDPRRLEQELRGQAPATTPPAAHSTTAPATDPWPEYPPASDDEPRFAAALSRPPARPAGPAQRALSLLLQNPALAREPGILEPLARASLGSPDAGLLLKLLQEFQQTPDTSVASLLGYWPNDEERELLARLAAEEPLLGEARALAHEFRGFIKILEKQELAREQAQRLRSLASDTPLNYSDLSPEQKAQFGALFRPARP